MESGTADATRIGPPPPRWGFDRRLMGVAIVTEITAILLAFVAVNVPLQGPKLTPEERLEHWPAAAIGALVVLLGVLYVVRETRRARRLNPPPASGGAGESLATQELPRVPRALLVERVP